MTIGCLQPFILMICLPLATWTELNFLTSVFTQFIPVLPLLYPYCIIYLPQVHCLTLNYDVFQVLCTQDPTKTPGVESVIGDLWSWFKTYLTACWQCLWMCNQTSQYLPVFWVFPREACQGLHFIYCISMTGLTYSLWLGHLPLPMTLNVW